MAQRIGLIVPSSNVTMETELPALLGHDHRTYHSSRAALHNVDRDSLHEMVCEGPRCVSELIDADVDVIGYACLVALMAEGHGAHERIENELSEIASDEGKHRLVVSSAGALVRTLQQLGIRKAAVVAPYSPDLTELVLSYISSYGIEIVDFVALNVTDNLAVGRLDPANLPQLVSRLDLSKADGIVLSACVQMPSLPAVKAVQDATGLPVVTAATATARELLMTLNDTRLVSAGGAALDRTR